VGGISEGGMFESLLTENVLYDNLCGRRAAVLIQNEDDLANMRKRKTMRITLDINNPLPRLFVNLKLTSDGD
jgi:hypothetical protein